MEVRLHTPIRLTSMHKNNFTFLWIEFPSVSASCLLVQNYRCFIPLHLTVLINKHSTVLEFSISMSHFCSLVQVMLLHLLPYSQGCCVIQELSVFGLVPVKWPPLWSSGQSFWLQIQRSRVRFPALPNFLSSSGSGTGSTQPREVNWGATWIKSSGSGLENRD